jgi:5-formyltetrahydrofolate cyclo-ligase
MTENHPSKELLRQNFKTLRAQVPQLAAMAASLALWSQLKLQPQFNNARRIAAFAPTKTEINITPVLEGILNLNKELYLPKTDEAQKMIQFHAIKNLKELVPGPFSILEPPFTAVLEPNQIDLILVPGLAFDRRGHRLGYGHGYYDRLLNLISPKCFSIGIGYSFQIVEKIPDAQHDIPLKALLTEKSFFLWS